MKCGIEDAYLWYVGEYGFDGLDAGHIGGVVQRCQNIALAYHVFDGFVYEYALVEFLAAVYQPMSHCLYTAIILDTSFCGVGE